MPVIEQWLSGRDYARETWSAAEMVNFTYLIGDPSSGKAWLVDPAWDVQDLINQVQAKGFSLEGALYTHWHPDHAGGDLFGLQVAGAAELIKDHHLPVHMHREDIPYYIEVAPGIATDEIMAFDGDAVLSLGGVKARCLHTPGHSPGSTCFVVTDDPEIADEPPALISGDLLFVGSCGRMDLPGSNPEEMYKSLNERLAFLPDETTVYPGHHYGPKPVSTLSKERQSNMALRVSSLDAWLATMA
jgi:glyoxylase-like metal-dependent hydrolase (beta-lactamase superfamily II)